MGNDRDDGALSGDSWTDVEQSPPREHLEAVPIRRGMVLAERWAIEEILGQGGMGIVVRARDRALGVTVAIKIVRAELAGDRSWAERLAREVKLARQIHHPNVCRVFDLGHEVARVFLVMELATKGTLRDELRARAAYAARPLADRLADARAVAAGLAAIHAAGIVHRDVSPQNVLRLDDGRLAVSDFGLATDDVDSTTSVHGGTIAYMAPELVRGGGRASMASDIWALGVVIHELVFGDKPTWREPVASDMRPPSLGRPLAPPERAAFEIARVCTAADPGKRTVTAAEVARMLADGARPRRAWRARVSARSLAILTVVVATVAAGVIWVGARGSRVVADQHTTEQAPLIVPTGQSADWTKRSVVLAEVPERISCTSLLPDHKTIRFVWGDPRRAEDVDTVTRRRVPSPLVPAAYAEGCPDVSPDGKRLVYQGHTTDGRPFAFLSDRPDGRDAVAIAQTAEPSMASEPTWISDEYFSYEADPKHVGVFSTVTGRGLILPEVSSGPYVTSFRSVVGQDVLAWVVSETGDTEFVRLAIPSLQERSRFRLKGFAMDLTTSGGRLYGVSLTEGGGRQDLIQLDVGAQTARFLGTLPGRFTRYPKFVDGGMTFVSIGGGANLYSRSAGGVLVRVTVDDDVYQAAHCGSDFVVTRRLGAGADSSAIERIDSAGRVIEVLSTGVSDESPGCAPDGKTWFFARHVPLSVVNRCNRFGCRDIAHIHARGLSVSPDGKRLAFALLDRRGPTVGWMSAEGGELHVVAESETGCAPGWSSTRTLWVSRRRSGAIVWTEMDADTGRETGKTASGSRDCTNSQPDPASPVDPDIRVVFHQPSQLRFIRQDELAR